MNTKKIKGKSVKMIAHRGLSGIECENTNAAFVAAGNRSYFGIETDVHVTVDGKFAIIHDDNTFRVSYANLIVEDCTMEQLEGLSLKKPDFREDRGDLRIPQLKEYIGICKKYEKTAVLELKNRMKSQDIENIIGEIEKADYLDKVIFISFSWENLLDVKKMRPQQKVQFLIGSWEDSLLDRLLESKMDLDIEYRAVTPELVEKLHQNGIEINCWTCDDAAAAERLISYGVDYITSNILE